MSDTTPRMMRRFKQTLDSTKVLIAALLLLLVASPSHAETYFYHTDHLGTPQVLTNKNQTVVWQAALEPFGEVTEAVALVEQNLRFPGQYLDRESGLHYNYFRSYNSDTGRYTQSDPIGLYGGINTYGYAYQNPLKYTDPTGEIVPIIVWAWTAFEIASTAYDVYNAASTFADECSSTSDKLIAGSVLAAGVFLPGRYSFVANSADESVEVYRVFGGDARAIGYSYTTVDPRTVDNFRDAAGLPSGGSSGANNTADFLLQGTANKKDIIESRDALPLDGNSGGLPELVIDPSNVDITDFSVLRP